MTALFNHQGGKVKASCTISGCGWTSPWAPDMSGARLELAYHNYINHPGVFPRWNPGAKAVEKGVRKEGAGKEL